MSRLKPRPTKQLEAESGERRLGEKTAERCALRAPDFMSELKLRPPGGAGQKAASL
jgi:hypothetical protein